MIVEACQREGGEARYDSPDVGEMCWKAVRGAITFQCEPRCMSRIIEKHDAHRPTLICIYIHHELSESSR